MLGIDALTQECRARFLPRRQDTTDTAGRYRVQLGEFGTAFTICVRVHATPASASGLAPDSTTRSPVQMRSPFGDSLRVDFQLGPSV